MTLGDLGITLSSSSSFKTIFARAPNCKEDKVYFPAHVSAPTAEGGRKGSPTSDLGVFWPRKHAGSPFLEMFKVKQPAPGDKGVAKDKDGASSEELFDISVSLVRPPFASSVWLEEASAD